MKPRSSRHRWPDAQDAWRASQIPGQRSWQMARWMEPDGLMSRDLTGSTTSLSWSGPLLSDNRALLRSVHFCILSVDYSRKNKRKSLSIYLNEESVYLGENKGKN